MKRFWVGLEHEERRPNGFGEDYREYVEVEDHKDEAEKIRGAVLRLAQDLTGIGDGDRIAVHEITPATGGIGLRSTLFIPRDLRQMHREGWVFRWEAATCFLGAYHPDGGAQSILEIRRPDLAALGEAIAAALNQP